MQPWQIAIVLNSGPNYGFHLMIKNLGNNFDSGNINWIGKNAER